MKTQQKILFAVLFVLSYLSVNSQSLLQGVGLSRDNFQTDSFSLVQQKGGLTKSNISTTSYSGVQSFPLDFNKTSYLLDSNINRFEIGKIPKQRVMAGSFVRFVLSSSHTGTGIVFQILNPEKRGVVKFNQNSKLFTFHTSSVDTFKTLITFLSRKGTDTIRQAVEFEVYHPSVSNSYVFGVGNSQTLPSPTDKAYQLLSVINNQAKLFNGIQRPTRSISISAFELEYENVAGNLLATLSGAEDIEELNLYAERITIKDAFKLPGTNVNIYCNEIVFEDVVGKPKAMIETTPVQPDLNNGMNGQTAGNLSLFARRLIDNFGGFRFYLLGGRGASNMGTALAGEGGDGGNFISNLDLGVKVDNLGGFAGSQGGVPLKYKGLKGSIILDLYQFKWIHPNYIRQVLAYCDDAYLLGFGPNVLPKVLSYDMLIDAFSKSAEFYGINDNVQADLLQTNMEMVALGTRLLSGLDYYGNPAGWIPMLSFEFTQAAFESELNNASKILYLNAFLGASADTLSKLLSGYQALRTTLKDQSLKLKEGLDELVFMRIPELELSIKNNELMMDSLKNKIALTMEEIDRQANADRQAQIDEANKMKWIKVASSIGKIATMVPIPIVQGIGAGVVAATQFYQAVQGVDNFNLENAGKIIDAGASAFETFKGYSETFEQKRSSMNSLVNQVKDFFPVFDGQMTTNALKAKVEEGKSLFGNLKSKFNEVANIYKENMNIPDPDLRKIKSDLIAQSPVLAKLNADMENAGRMQKQLLDDLNSANEKVLRVSAEITANALAFDNTNSKITTTAYVLDHRTVHYIAYLRNNALRRLKMYHYYMAKAFEFRRLMPYTGNLNIQAVLSSAENMVVTANSAILNQQQYDAILAVYQNQMSQVAEDVYKEYTSNNVPSRVSNNTFRLTKAEINQLNEGKTVKLNLSRLGIFEPNQENIRIANLRVFYMKDSASSNFVPGVSPKISVKFTYPYESRVKYRGKVYYFNNYNSSTVSPISWTTTYDKFSANLNQVVPSPSAQSFLRSLLIKKSINPGSEQMLMFSQPSADADLLLTATFTNLGAGARGRLFIDSMLFAIDYDYNQELNTDASLKIVAEPDWMAPTYTISQTDKNGMNNGQDELVRNYQRSNGVAVQVKAEPTIGGYKFDKWLDQSGSPLNDKDSSNPSRVFNMGQSQFYRVSYKWNGPELSVPDTIFLTDKTTSTNLLVSNIGQPGMSWIIDSTQIPAFIQLSTIRGLNTQTVLVSLKNGITDSLLFGRIRITAPFAKNPFDSIVVSYRKTSTEPVSIVEKEKEADFVVYPNPSSNSFIIEMSAGETFAYRVFDLFAKEVVSGKSLDSKKEIEFPGTGVFILEVTNRFGTVSTKKIIKL